jgi:hypothetical protein
MEMMNLDVAAAYQLPATRQELLASRALKQKRTINDLVEDIVVANWEDQDFIRFIGATKNKDAVEGSIRDDDVMAALYIRNKALKLGAGFTEVADATLLDIRHALTVALHRYRKTRADRRRSNGGQSNGGSPAATTE